MAQCLPGLDKKIDDTSAADVVSKQAKSVMATSSPTPNSNQGHQRKKSGNPEQHAAPTIRYSRIFKKTSQDGNLVLFLPQREIMITETRVEPLMGVALVHENLLQSSGNYKIFLQVVLVFRYGREDEELMGLRFCNEIVIAAEQIHPASSTTSSSSTSSEPSPLPLISSSKTNSQGFLAVPFALDMGISAPPSVRLMPSRPYSGAPIGTAYEVQLFVGRSPEELPRRNKMVQMSLRLYERTPRDPPPKPVVSVEKNYLFSENNLVVQARLDSGSYAEGDTISVSVLVRRLGGHGARRLKLTAIQQVSVAMFSTGNFKNCVGEAPGEDLDPADSCFRASISFKLELGKNYSWVAMDDTSVGKVKTKTSKNNDDNFVRQLAPTVVHANKALFIIRVHYFVHLALCFGAWRRSLVVKLPFMLHRSTEKPKQGEKQEQQ